MPGWVSIEAFVQMACVLLLCAAGLTQKAKPLQWALAFAVVAVAFVDWRLSGEGWFFWIVLFVVCGKGVSVRKAAGVTLASAGIVLAVCAISSLTGMVSDTFGVRETSSAVRMSLGFVHPNAFGALLVSVCVGVGILTFDEHPWLSVSLAALFAIGVFCIAHSRTSALCLGMLVVLLLIQIFCYKLNFDKALSYCYLGLFILIVIASVVLMVCYDQNNAFMAWLNDILTGRLRLAHLFYVEQAPGLFGHSYADGAMVLVGSEKYSFIVDNMYDHLMLRSGIVAWALFVIAIILFYVKAIKEGVSGFVLLGITLFMVYGFSETLGCRVECNFLIICLSSVLYGLPLSSLRAGTPVTEQGGISCKDAVSRLIHRSR